MLSLLLLHRHLALAHDPLTGIHQEGHGGSLRELPQVERPAEHHEHEHVHGDAQGHEGKEGSTGQGMGQEHRHLTVFGPFLITFWPNLAMFKLISRSKAGLLRRGATLKISERVEKLQLLASRATR